MLLFRHGDERLEDPAAVRIKRAGKVAGLVYRKQIGLDRAGNIVFGEGAADRKNEWTVPSLMT